MTGPKPRLRSSARLLAAAIWCAACGAQDPRAELLELAAAKDPGARSRELTACMYDSILERHGAEVAHQLVEMARANARGVPMPPNVSDTRAVLALSLQEAARCTEQLRREQSAPEALPREARIPRGTRS